MKTLRLCLSLWSRIFQRALWICSPVLLCLVLYFSPALVLDKDLGESLHYTLYTIPSIAMRWIFYFGFVCVYGFLFFGPFFGSPPFFMVLLPGMLCCSFVHTFTGLNLVVNFLSLFFIVSAFIRAYHLPLPLNPSNEIAEIYDRKLKTTLPLMKMVISIGAIFFALQIVLPIYLGSSMGVKIAIRFVALPLVGSLCSGLQIHFLNSAPRKYVDYAHQILWISNGGIKIYERLFANTMFRTQQRAYFAASMLCAALMEILNHTTYFHRITFVQRLINIFSSFGKYHKRVKSMSVLPESRIDTTSQESDFEHEWMLEVRKKIILDDITIEPMMVFTVTLIMYCLHPLSGDARFEPIYTVHDFVIQVAIQLIFEILSDLFGLYWTITKTGISISLQDLEIAGGWYWLWLAYLFWQTAELTYWLLRV